MKIESANVQIPTPLFVQLVKFLGTSAPESDPEREDQRQYILSQLNDKLEKMKKREEYARSHCFKQ